MEKTENQGWRRSIGEVYQTGSWLGMVGIEGQKLLSRERATSVNMRENRSART